MPPCARDAQRVDVFAPEDGLWARAFGDGVLAWAKVGAKSDVLKRLASFDEE